MLPRDRVSVFDCIGDDQLADRSAVPLDLFCFESEIIRGDLSTNGANHSEGFGKVVSEGSWVRMASLEGWMYHR